MNLKKTLLGITLLITPLFYLKSQEYPTLYDKKLAQEAYWESKEGFRFKMPKFPLSLLNKLKKEWSSYEYYIHDGNEILFIHKKDSLGSSEIKIIEEDHYGIVEKFKFIRTEPGNSFILVAEEIGPNISQFYKIPKEGYPNKTESRNINLDCYRELALFKDEHRINEEIEKYNPKKPKKFNEKTLEKISF